jgi:hypothetical protein
MTPPLYAKNNVKHIIFTTHLTHDLIFNVKCVILDPYNLGTSDSCVVTCERDRISLTCDLHAVARTTTTRDTKAAFYGMD